ncbi:hypothetical protein RR46_00288 [Papilio xuthus]|uniref:Uncharacterized protein n=1 Tax=Papilio xuthus TaxID=66420 RepID=A0A0N1PEN5_PAPXU|nr:hypothetical protein RR46_00288 [Papilio xuthus]
MDGLKGDMIKKGDTIRVSCSIVVSSSRLNIAAQCPEMKSDFLDKLPPTTDQILKRKQ